MKFVLLAFLFCSCVGVFAQSNGDSLVVATIQRFQNELNREYRDSSESPLGREDRLHFTNHDFYPIDLRYRVHAAFVRTPEEKVFNMKTTGTRTPEYVKYGEARFELNGKKFVLNLYRNIALTQREEYKNHLFLPFTDNTNGEETYGGGRYIDLTVPGGDTIIIDFNQAYNPYCAYSDRYSCPIPPKENYLDTEIKAGIRYTGHH